MHKIVNFNELYFNIITSTHDISPTLLNYHLSENGNHQMNVDKYPYTLFDFEMKDRSKYLDQLKILVNNLHQLGIVHNDLSEENIVISKEGIVKLIDFGRSKLIQNITQEDIEDRSDEFNLSLSSKQDYLNSQLDELVYICTGKFASKTY